MSSQPPSHVPDDYLPPPPSDYMPPDNVPPPSHGGLDPTGPDFDVGGDNFDLPPEFGYIFGDEVHEDIPLGGGASGHRVADPPHVTRIYHSNLDGMLIVLNTYSYFNFAIRRKNL
jgi:hypothetical protein